MSSSLSIYLTLVRPVVEYACQVWSTGLTKKQSQTLESIQKRALRIISPGETYEDACVVLSLSILKERRDTPCKSFFNDMLNPNHRLHHMLPDKRQLITRAHLNMNCL